MQAWATHRSRAEVLRERYPFAAEVLGLYVALLDVWSDVDPSWPASDVVPRVVAATAAAGPDVLAKAVAEIEDPAAVLDAYLSGAELAPAELYLARASLYPLLASAPASAPASAGHCPHCGGLPQVSVRGESGEALVSSGRSLVCSRCGRHWSFSSSTCPSCGETTGAKRTVYAEQHDGPVIDRSADPGMFPHLRIDACGTCQHYLIDVDLGRDPRAVPAVDELAALPLALYANDQGLTKITPNLMGL
jgi:formate dehydrogenase maturation protein FdhE